MNPGRPSFSLIGSGTLPFLNGQFPDVPSTDLEDIQVRDGSQCILINPEDFSVHYGGDTTQVVLTPNVVQRVDLGIPGRRAIKITNINQSAIVYIGFKNNITTSNGDALLPYTSISIDCKNTIKIYAICSTSVTLTVMEVK